jgi:hypothetical protein
MTRPTQEFFPPSNDEVEILPPEELDFLGFTTEGVKEAIKRIRQASYDPQTLQPKAA